MSQHGLAKTAQSFKSFLGFTLVELITVIAILSILISLAVPRFISAQHAWEAKETQRYIIQSFRLAKATSYMHSQDIILCLADINDVCHKDASHSLLLFSDQDGNHQYDKQHNAIISKQVLNLDYARVYLRAGRRHHIKFFGNSGLPRGHFGHIKYCPSSGATPNMYQISLNQQGLHRFKPYSFKVTGCP